MTDVTDVTGVTKVSDRADAADAADATDATQASDATDTTDTADATGGTGGTAATDVTAPFPVEGLPIDPRIHERLVSVQRAEGRRRRKIVATIVGVVAVIGLAVGLTQLPVLAVQHVNVTGNAHTSRAAILAATRLDQHPQMIDLNSGRLRRELLSLPWVASARVHRHWPTTVSIHVSERTPVADVASAGHAVAIVDRDGRILATGSGATDTATTGPAVLPLLRGVGPPGPAGTFLTLSPHQRDALTLAGALPAALPAAFANRLQDVGARPDGTLQATLTPGIRVVFGSVDNLDAKLLTLRTLLERVDLRRVATVDVHVPDAPFLTPR